VLTEINKKLEPERTNPLQHHITTTFVITMDTPTLFGIGEYVVDCNYNSILLTRNRQLGEQLVSLYVGEKRKRFVVHQQLLIKTADFFGKELADQAPKSAEQQKARGGKAVADEHDAIYLKSDDANVISLFVHWLYRKQIAFINTQAHLDNLYGLYFFAEKISRAELANKTLDTI